MASKHVFRISSSAVDAEPRGGQFYDGDKPPVGVYTVAIKLCRLRVNKNGDDFVSLLLVVDETDPKKKEYNGYGMWDQLNITDDQAGNVNEWLDAAGIPRKSFWPPNGPTLDNAEPPNITKIGTKRPEGLRFRVSTADHPYKGEVNLVPKRYLPLKNVEPDVDEPVDDVEADEPDDAEVVADTGDFYEADAGDDDEPDFISEEELKEYDLEDLQGICDAWDIKYTAKANAATLIKKILALQEEASAGKADEADEADEASDDSEEVSFTKDELKEYELDDLKTILTDTFKAKLPKPPIKPKLITAILDAQEANGGKAPF